MIVNTSTGEQGQATVQMNAADQLSGIDHYTLQVDQEKPIIVLPDTGAGSATATLPAMSGTDHTVFVQAFDRAKNMTQAVNKFNSSVPTAINITAYPTSIKVGEKIKIVGQTSYPNAMVSISLAADVQDIKTFKVQADDGGVFRFESEAIASPGIDTLWADILNQNGSTILSSGKVSITIRKPLLLQIGSYATELFSALIPAVALLLVLIFLIYYAWHKFFRMRKLLKKDLAEAHGRIHKAFKTLSEEATGQLLVIEKSAGGRKLSATEKKAVEDLRDAISQVDEYTEKLVQKIEDTDL